MKRILIIPGSQRRESLSRRLAATCRSLLQPSGAASILEPSEVDLPIFNEDLESDPELLDRLIAVHRRFEESDALLVISPEYNASVSPYLKNTVDWVSRMPRILPERGSINPFLDKPLLLASASPGWSGGALGLQAARAIFSYLGSLVLPDQLTLPYADDAWSGDGTLADPFFADRLLAALERLGVLMNLCAVENASSRLGPPVLAVLGKTVQ